MDRSTLHELERRGLRAESAGEDGRREGSATGNSRSFRTGGHTGRSETESEASKGNAMPSTPSLLSARELSWEDQSDDEEPRLESPRVGSRASMEASTPTLIDEADFIDEEEEQEMVSLERERLRRTNPGLFMQEEHEESNLRRTPGAQMYRSSIDQDAMRRTPGASQMHRSTVPQMPQQEQASGDASGLGFGLTLSTPVAASNKDKPLNLATPWQVPRSAETNAKQASKVDEADRPPLPPASGNTARDQRAAFITPWNLAKATSNTESGRGAYSPNTLRLQEDLGNLLLDDEADLEPTTTSTKFVFGSAAREKDSQNSQSNTGTTRQEAPESWTAPYVISMDSPSRVPRSATTRNRRGKTDGSRRSRGHDRTSSVQRHFEDNRTAKTGGFLQYPQHQPKPVRTGQPPAFAPVFSSSPISFGNPMAHLPATGMASAPPEDEHNNAPALLNFSGAFVPPSKSQGDAPFHRPVASSPSTKGSSGPMQQPATGPGSHPTFSAGTPPVGAPGFHNPFQQTAARPHFGAPPPKFQPQFAPQAFSFAPPNMAYPMHAPVPPNPPDFVPNMPVMQRPQMPPMAPPPQVWPPPMMEMQYEGMGPPMDHGNWHSGHGAWHMGAYPYGMPPSTTDSAGVTVAPPQAWTPEPELVPDLHPLQSMHPPAPSPVPGTKASKKASRKGKGKGSKPNPKTDKAQKTESSSQGAAGKKSPVAKKNKKKQAKEKGGTIEASVSNPTEESKVTADETVDAKRTEPQETQATRSAFKDFYRKFRAEERNSFHDAEAFARNSLSDGSLPESIHWKVYLELADLAKRANKFGDARNLYDRACRLQPNASQGWLEFSKLEEECGNMMVCAKILRAGLEHCQYNENLLTRAIKHEEKMGNLNRARELLSRLKHVGIEKVWRTVLEGALLEARAGNDVMARRVLKYLMHHVPWYGPLYLEAYKLEKDLGRAQEAYEIVERGLAAIPRYGPLWFGAFKLCEEFDLVSQRFSLPQSMTMIDRAVFSISKELVWKVHLEAAQMLERSAVEYLDSTTNPTAEDILDQSRKRFAMTVLSCPPNLRWKVWLASGRMEVAAGNSDRARRLFLRAHSVVPDKGRAVALLECARLEEYVGDVDLAKAILCQSRNVSGSDWKVWLESVLLEIRCGNRGRATELAKLALQLHSGTGRLWASLVQLRHYEDGEAAQFDTLSRALNAVPKSGEVWCEGARIHLNPFSKYFSIPRARRHLLFATKFTPQYGDGFLETLKLEILDQWLVPISKLIWESTRDRLDLDNLDKEDALSNYVREVSQDICAICTGDYDPKGRSIDRGTAGLIRSTIDPGYRDKMVDISDLKQRCANADPNYGSLWFYCRETPTGTARKVLSKAVKLMKEEIRLYAHIYLAALIRRLAILTRMDRDLRRETSDSQNEMSQARNTSQLEGLAREACFSCPSLEEIMKDGNEPPDTTANGMDLLESTMTSSNFVCGLVAVSIRKSVETMSMSDKRKALFGTDALFS